MEVLNEPVLILIRLSFWNIFKVVFLFLSFGGSAQIFECTVFSVSVHIVDGCKLKLGVLGGVVLIRFTKTIGILRGGILDYIVQAVKF